MLSFDSSNWTKSVVDTLVQLHQAVFESVLVNQQGEDIILEYEKGAVIITTDRERCDIFDRKFKENLEPPSPPPSEEEVRLIMQRLEELMPDVDWSESEEDPPPPLPEVTRVRIPLFFYGQDGIEMDGRQVLGLYLIDRIGVAQFVEYSSRDHRFADERWTERILAARLIGTITSALMKEAGTHGVTDRNERVLLAEYTYLTYNQPEKFLSLFPPLVLLKP